MGDLIKDFWTYTYKGRSYFGIVEVVKGDLIYRKAEGKYETRVEKALAYVEGTDVLSHMSVQSYVSYLSKSQRESRTAEDQAYYPFYLEFEPKLKPGQAGFNQEYESTAEEAHRAAQYLIYEYGVDPGDLLIVITNSRSIYLFVNPKAYNAVPSNKQHLIYKRMFEQLDNEIGLQYVDESHFRFNGLIKTPGAYYAGGYVVPITLQELKVLSGDVAQKAKLTQTKRALPKTAPGAIAAGLIDLYRDARELIESQREKKQIEIEQPVHTAAMRSDRVAMDNVLYMPQVANCVKRIEAHGAEQGQRNFALVSLAIAYKNAGYSEAQVYDIVQAAADKWQHDESARVVASKVRTVFKKDYRFSCEYIKDHVDLCSACEGCRFKKGSKTGENGVVTKFRVNRGIIALLKEQKASLRHYKAYLIMSRYQLLGKAFKPEEYHLDPRTIRELAKMANGTRTLSGGFVTVILPSDGHNYMFPVEFVDTDVYNALGEKLKAYLTLYTRFVFKAGDRYGLMRIKAATVASALGYEHNSSAYKLIRELASLGYAVFKNGYLFTLYFESYKLISLQEYKAAKVRKATQKRPAEGLKTGTNDSGDSRLYWKLSRGSP